MKYSATGARLWAATAPTTGSAIAYGATVAADDRAIYIAGFTTGVMTGSGATNAGQIDAFVSAFTPRGKRLWSRQIGSGATDIATSVAADADGNVYVAGHTFGTLPGSPVTHPGEQSDAFVIKYDAAGSLQWVRQLDVANSLFEAVAVSGSGYIDAAGAGGTSPYQGLVARYAPDGTLQWTKFFADRFINGLGEDAASNIYVSGYTPIDLPDAKGHGSAFVMKLDPDGAFLANAVFGAPNGRTSPLGLAVTPEGNAYLTGYVRGQVRHTSDVFAGALDVFIVKYDRDLRRRWAHLCGTNETEDGFAVAPAARGGVVVAGNTHASGTWANARGAVRQARQCRLVRSLQRRVIGDLR